jgi:hypothetical protein
LRDRDLRIFSAIILLAMERNAVSKAKLTWDVRAAERAFRASALAPTRHCAVVASGAGASPLGTGLLK